MKISIFSFLLFMVLLASSCQEGAFYEHNETINNRSWDYAQIKKFPVHVDNAKQRYAFYVSIRHTSDYDFSNIFLRVFSESATLKDTTRFEIKLAETDGRWTGRKTGDLYEHQVLVKDNYAFSDTGTYIFSLEQNMRENPLLHINDVGIKLVKK